MRKVLLFLLSAVMALAPTLTYGQGATPVPGPAPWIDVRAYGMKARTSFPTTTATTSGTSVMLGASQDFVNGDGAVIWKAGEKTLQSRPAAPIVTSPAIHGTRTINYECVGVDSMGGLTQASLPGTVTNAPNSMGEQPSRITRLTQTSGTVAVELATPLSRGAAGVMVAIQGATGAYAVLNGYYPIAAFTDSTHFTYALPGNLGAASMNTYGGWARVSNTFQITSISRSGTTITLTTNQNHGFQVQHGGYGAYSRTIAVVQGVDQLLKRGGVGPTNDMNGEYVILTAGGNTMTLDTAIDKTETGNLRGYAANFQPTVTVYEYNLVKCPSLRSGKSATVAYYVYADYANSGMFKLIGKTLPGYPGQSDFYDYGPWQGGAYSTLYLSPTGYVAPGYVPTTAPESPQRQLWVGKIVAGGGTTGLTVEPTVPFSGSGLTFMHDESVAFAAAITASQAVRGGTVLIPPAAGSYVINAPMQFPRTGISWTDIKVGGALTINETINTGYFSSWKMAEGASNTGGQSFSRTRGPNISGLASPMIASLVGTLSLEQLNFEGSSSASQTEVYAAGAGLYGLTIDKCTFAVGGGGAGTSVPLVMGGIAGITAEDLIKDSEFIGFFNGLGNGGTSGGSDINIGPNIPLIWARANDDNAGGMAQLTMAGENVFAGRGILFDGTYGQMVGGQNINYFEYQAPATPTVMFYGTANFGGPIGTISNGNNDSQPGAIVGNWSPFGVVALLTLDNVVTSGLQSLITGSAVQGLMVKNSSAVHPIGQNFGVDTVTTGNADLGSGARATPEQQLGMPLIVGGPSAYPIGIQIPQVTGVTATATSNPPGTIAAGSYSISVTAVGWNGGENVYSQPAIATVNGSQSVTVGWESSPANVKGYNAYLNGQRQNRSLIVSTATSYIINSIGNSGGGSNIDGTGMPMMDRNGVYGPLFLCPEKGAPSGVAGADIIYCDSSSHSLKMINNNGAPITIGGGSVVVSGTSALGTSPIASGACTSTVTTRAPGALATDNLFVDFNADPSALTGYGVSTKGQLAIYKWIARGNVNFKVCNSTGSSIKPGAATLQWRVIR